MDALPSDATCFHFDKTLLTRLQECRDILQSADGAEPVTASRVRAEWAYFAELQIEPAGWLAYWRMPRCICESFGIAYPTVVFGCVESVVYAELRAHFTVTGVQDAAAVQLPDRHDVALVDLLPVREQENGALNIERTAECVDMLRYFYQHVWRPWDADGDEDADWATQHLERRIRFHHDLMQRRVGRPLAVHVRALLAEALDVQQRREYLETDISDDEDVNETMHKTEITDLMRLHLRLANLRSELEILENPEMRTIYEDVRNRGENGTDTSTSADSSAIRALIVCPIGTAAQQRSHLDWCEQRIGPQAQSRIMSSLQQCLDACLTRKVTICLPAGRHAIKFAEPLQGKMTIAGRGGGQKEAGEKTTVIAAREDDSTLLQVDDTDCVVRLQGCTFDCSRVRTGIWLRRGSLQLTNCHFIGGGGGGKNTASNTKCAITVHASCHLRMVDCTVRDFAVGVKVVAKRWGGDRPAPAANGWQPPELTHVCLEGTTAIGGCGTAIECAPMRRPPCQLHVAEGVRLGPTRRYGIAWTLCDPAEASKYPDRAVFETVAAAKAFGLLGECQFEGNGHGNVVCFKYNANHLFEEEEEEEEGAEEEMDKDAATEKSAGVESKFAVPEVPAQRRVEPKSSTSSDSEEILVSDSDTEMSSSVIMLDD